MFKKATNTYLGGMNKDSSKLADRSKTYYDAYNFRILTDVGESTGAIENMKGNSSKFDLGDDRYIVAWKCIRDEIIILATDSFRDSSTSNSYIYRMVYDYSTAVQIPTCIYNDIGLTGRLGFSLSYPIVIEPMYETPLIRKIYWSDYNDYLRYANIQELVDITTAGTTYPEPGSFDILNDVDLNVPDFVSLNAGGSIKYGKTAYSYQLYKLNGAQTAYSPISQMVHVEDGNGNCGIAGNNSGNSVSMSISTIDSRFDMIRVVSVHYGDKDADPTITIILEDEISDSRIINFTDDGRVALDTYTVAEFRIIGKELFTCKALSSKDNMLFPSNIKYDYFDIDYDARAYRFPRESTSTTIDGNSITETTFDTIDEEDDCINSDTTQYNHRWQFDSTVLGGTGPNISYSFINRDVKIDGRKPFTNVYDSKITLGNDEGYASNSYDGVTVGYQRDEIYRFGIVFHDDKGRDSYVKWIADIRMPHISDVNDYVGTTIRDVSSNNISAQALGIVFNINIPDSVLSQINGFSIVRMERKDADKTILAQGITGKYFEPEGGTSGLNKLCATPWLMTIEQYFLPSSVGGYHKYAYKDVLEFASPEINYLGSINSTSGDTLEVVGTISPYQSQWSHWCKKANAVNAVDNYTSSYHKVDILDSVLTKPSYDIDYTLEGARFPVSSRVYWNWDSDADPVTTGFKGTCMVIKGDSQFYNESLCNDRNDSHFLVNYKRELSNQYGGNTYASRTRSDYIPCYHQQVGAGNDYTRVVYEGDTYIGYHDYLRVQSNYDRFKDRTRYESIQFPVETSINLTLNYGETLSDHNNWHLQETAGIRIFKEDEDNPDDTTTVTQEKDMYLYNRAYSRDNNVFRYYSKPINFNDTRTYDVMTKYSEIKASGENIDSWLTFKDSNFNEVDSKYGPINATNVIKNQLIYLQDKAVGTWSVNQKSLVTDNTGATLALGDGGVLDRYDYITTTSGCKHKFAQIVSKNKLYYVDALNKKFMILSGDEVSISDVKGMSSWFRDIISEEVAQNDSILNGRGIILGKDTEYNDIYISIRDARDVWGLPMGASEYDVITTTINNKTLVYNELLQKFTTFSNALPKLYLSCENELFSSNDLTGGYVHNRGNYGEYYGTYYPSTITPVVGLRNGMVGIFTNLEFISEVFQNNIENQLETIDSYEFYNNYQSTGVITATYPDTIKRKFRTWRLKIPRAVEDAQGTAVTVPDARIVSPYTKINLSFTNDSRDRRLILHDLGTIFSVSNK